MKVRYTPACYMFPDSGQCNSLDQAQESFQHNRKCALHAQVSWVPGILMASMGVLSGIPAIHLTVSEFESLNEPASARFYRCEESNHLQWDAHREWVRQPTVSVAFPPGPALQEHVPGPLARSQLRLEEHNAFRSQRY